MVPPRSALQCCGGVLVRVGRKGSIFALTLGDVAAKEQSLFSWPGYTDPGPGSSSGSAGHLHLVQSWSPSWLSSYMVGPRFQNTRLLETSTHLEWHSGSSVPQSLWKMQITGGSGGFLSHLRSASISSFSPIFRGWRDGRGKTAAVDGSGNRELKLEWVQSLNCPLLPRGF